MLKTILLVAALSTTTPALAQNTNFVGTRAEITAGVNNIVGAPDLNDVVYGAAIGFDIPVGSKLTAGIEANTSNIFEKQRQIGTAARVGYALTPNVLAYVKGGYNNYKNSFSQKLDGAVVGTGLQFAVTPHSYVKVQYDYSDFANNTGSHSVLAGVGFRF
jgi:outer membrane immunogenic protein